jgi:hypothetical protein
MKVNSSFYDIIDWNKYLFRILDSDGLIDFMSGFLTDEVPDYQNSVTFCEMMDAIWFG